MEQGIPAELWAILGAAVTALGVVAKKLISFFVRRPPAADPPDISREQALLALLADHCRSHCTEVDDLRQQVDALREVHEATDDDDVRRVWTPRRLLPLMEELRKGQEETIAAMRLLVALIRRHNEEDRR